MAVDILGLTIVGLVALFLAFGTAVNVADWVQRKHRKDDD
jgi:putative effector of murein hydrolase LrgA (UPF0299 family)